MPTPRTFPPVLACLALLACGDDDTDLASTDSVAKLQTQLDALATRVDELEAENDSLEAQLTADQGALGDRIAAIEADRFTATDGAALAARVDTAEADLVATDGLVLAL